MPIVHRSYSHPPTRVSGMSTESNSSGGCVDPGWGYDSIRVKREGSYTADLTPGWSDLQRRIKRGETIVLPLNYYERWDRELRADGRVTLTWKPFYCWQNGQWGKRTASCPAGPYPDGVRELSMTDVHTAISQSGIDAQARLHAAASKMWDGLDIITTLVESREVLRLLPDLVGSAKRLVQIEKSLIQKGFLTLRQAKAIPRELSSLYLSYRFGWEQLFRDFESITDHLNAIHSPLFRGTSGTSNSWSSNDRRWIGPYLNGESYEVSEDTAVNVSCRGTMVALSGLRDARKSAFFNPALAAWELIPYSWVIDYVFDIGNTIGAITSQAMVTKTTSAVGWNVSITRQTRIVNTNTGGTLDQYDHYGDCIDSIYCRLRVPTPISPKPSLAIKATVQSISNLFALIVQKLTRR
jgi:hypothetical protein